MLFFSAIFCKMDLIQSLSQHAQPNRTLLNLYNEPLKPCSTGGMAITGYTRDGQCSHHSGDSGSHHICVKNVRSKGDKPSFCDVTGQSNWCDQPSACADGNGGTCPIEKWCVCEWAFEDFVRRKGCDAFDIDAEATNALVLKHYDPEANKKAYDCIVKKRREQSSDALE